jgi:hypothetical protein
MTERDVASRRQELEDASGDLRELCEDVAVPMQAKQYVAYFCGATEESARNKAPRREAFYAGIDRFQQAFEALHADLAAAGYVPREVASIEKESAKFASLRQEIGTAAGD